MPDPGTIEQLKAAAQASECEVEAAFAQLAHVVNPLALQLPPHLAPASQPTPPESLRHGHGICTGLCATWLDLLARGEEDSFKERVSGLDDAGQRDKYSLDHALLTKTINLNESQKAPNWKPSPTLTNVTADSDTAKELLKQNTQVAYSIRRTRNAPPDDQSRYPIHSENLGEFVNWVNATRMGKRRFFLLDTRHHTMAAAKNRKGYLRFYDPNGGIVRTWYAKRLHKFLVLYLSTQKAFDAYRVSDVQDDIVKLEIRKYRPESW